MDLEDSSVEMQEKSLTEAAEDTKTLPKDFVEVHKKRKICIYKIINLNIVRLNLGKVIPQSPWV